MLYFRFEKDKAMSSFLIFYQTKPVEVHFTELIAGGEKRFMVKVGELGTVIKQSENKNWTCIGKHTLESDLLQTIGTKIIEHQS